MNEGVSYLTLVITGAISFCSGIVSHLVKEKISFWMSKDDNPYKISIISIKKQRNINKNYIHSIHFSINNLSGNDFIKNPKLFIKRWFRKKRYLYFPEERENINSKNSIAYNTVWTDGNIMTIRENHFPYFFRYNPGIKNSTKLYIEYINLLNEKHQVRFLLKDVDIQEGIFHFNNTEKIKKRRIISQGINIYND